MKAFLTAAGKRFVCSALVLLAACAPQEQAFSPSSAEPRLAQNRFITSDNMALPLRAWLPKKQPKAVILALHGMNDYSRAFEIPGESLKAKGIAVYAYDQRGFGEARPLGLWGGEENFERDLRECIAVLRAKYPRTPLFVLGESMGGAVAVSLFAHEDAPPVEGLILVSPALWGEETMSGFYRSTLWVAAHVLPFEQLTGEDIKILATDNFEVLKEMVKDPYVQKKTRIDAIYGLVGLMDDAYAEVPKVQTPTLLLYGGNDQVIPAEPIEKSRARFTAPLDYRFYPKGYHMLLRDINGERAIADIAHWVLDESSRNR